MEKNQVPADRPQQVGQAVILLYVTLGIGILRSILEASRNPELARTGFLMFITFGVLGIMWFFIHMIGKGKNWARITLLVLFVVGIPLSIFPLLQSLAANPLSGLLGLG